MTDKDKSISSIIRNFRKSEGLILLESQMSDHPASEKTFIAADPEISIKAFGNRIVINEHGEERVFEGNPWDALQEFRLKHQDWLFGFLGYDLKNFVEKLNSANPEIIKAPDLFFFVPGFLSEIDKDGNITAIRGELPKDLSRTTIQGKVTIQARNQISKESYIEKINYAKNQIKEGDYYEINISHPLEFTLDGKAWDLYQKMKEVGPVPFGSYIRCGDLEICSASPERFISKKENEISSQPIKGTISRSLENDNEKIEALINSEKERAENLMIVDLVRNDLGRIAQKGSVRVSKLFEVQSFETVHQMVSTIVAEAKEDVSAIDIIKACFPMGSMTGAPKIAALKAIEDLEDYKRGIYSGAIGYFTPKDDFDFSVVIRTAIIHNDHLVYPVGGAITSDSEPEQEWEETLLKAKAVTGVMK